MLPIFIQLDVTDDAFNADRIFRNLIGIKTLFIHKNDQNVISGADAEIIANNMLRKIIYHQWSLTHSV